MTKEGTDWTHIFLKFLYDHYTGWDVPLNTFFGTEYEIEQTDSHRGDAILELLKSLEKQNLITWVTQPGLDVINRPPTLANYNWNARLTFPGLVYISNYLRLQRQERIERQNRLITLISLLTLIGTMYFIGKTAVEGVSAKQVKDLDTTIQKQQKYIQQMSIHLKGIDSSLHAKPFFDTSKPKN